MAFSHPGGKFVAAGEVGHQPAVVVWDAASGEAVADLRGHKYGVEHVAFSPVNGDWLVSLGSEHDGHVCLWYGLPDTARHITGCLLTQVTRAQTVLDDGAGCLLSQETKVQTALDDVASSIATS